MAKPLDLPHGIVIMFDGPEWIGKSTQVRLTAEALRQQGFAVWTTRVNGGTPIGEALRAVMFGNYIRPASTDLHIHLAQQYALDVELKHKRHEKSIVLIDRSPLSIIAYQVFGSGLDEAEGYGAANEVLALLKPELLIAYSAPPEVLATRRLQANHSKDYFESQPKDYFERVNAGYASAAKHYDACIIEASEDVAAVHRKTMQQVDKVVSDIVANAASVSVTS